MALDLSTKNKQLAALDAAIWVGREIKNRGVVPKESDFQRVYPKVLLNDVLFLISNVGGVPFSPPTQLVQKIDQVLAKLETLRQTIEGHPEGYESFDAKSIPQQVLANPQFLGLSAQDVLNELEAARQNLMTAQYESYWLGREEATLLGAAFRDPKPILKTLWKHTVLPPVVTTAAGALAVTNPAMAVLALPALAVGFKTKKKIDDTIEDFQIKLLPFTNPAVVIEQKYKMAWRGAAWAIPKTLLFRTRYFTNPFGKSYPYKDFWPTELLGQGVSKSVGSLASGAEWVHKKVFKGSPTVWKEISGKVSENLKPFYWHSKEGPKKRDRRGPWGVVVAVVAADIVGTLAGRIIQTTAKKVYQLTRLNKVIPETTLKKAFGGKLRTAGFLGRNIGGGVFSLNTAAGATLGFIAGGPVGGAIGATLGGGYQTVKNFGSTFAPIKIGGKIYLDSSLLYKERLEAQLGIKTLTNWERLLLKVQRPAEFLAEARHLTSLKSGLAARLPIKGAALGYLISGGNPAVALWFALGQGGWNLTSYLPNYAVYQLSPKLFGRQLESLGELVQYSVYQGLSRLPLKPFAGLKALGFEKWLEGTRVGNAYRVHWTRNLVSGTKGGLISAGITLPFVFLGIAPVWLPAAAFGVGTGLNFGWNAAKNKFFPAKVAAPGKVGVVGMLGRGAAGIGNIWAGLTGQETGTVLGFNLSKLPIPGWAAKILTIGLNYGLVFAGVWTLGTLLGIIGVVSLPVVLVVAAVAAIITGVDYLLYKLTGKGLFAWAWEGIKAYYKLPTWAQAALIPIAPPIFGPLFLLPYLWKGLLWLLKGALGLLSKIPIIGGGFNWLKNALFGGVKAAISVLFGLLGAIISLLTGGDIAEAAVAGAIGLVLAGAVLNAQTIESAFFNPQVAPVPFETQNPFFSVDKTIAIGGLSILPTKAATIRNDQLPQDVTIGVFIDVKASRLLGVICSDVAIATPQNRVLFDRNVFCPSELPANTPFTMVAPDKIRLDNLSDSIVINTLTVTATPEGAGQITTTSTATVTIGTPPADCPSGWPTAHGNIQQGHDSLGPIGHARLHPEEAIDIGNSARLEVLSTFNGIVRVKDDIGNTGYGVQVRVSGICNGKEFRAIYAHLRATDAGLAVGLPISKGQRIGWVGATGHATGAHLHYGFLGLVPEPPYVPAGYPPACSSDADCRVSW